MPETNIHVAEFANSVDPDEAAHNEPLHLDLHYLPCGLNSHYDTGLAKKNFEILQTYILSPAFWHRLGKMFLAISQTHILSSAFW